MGGKEALEMMNVTFKEIGFDLVVKDLPEFIGYGFEINDHVIRYDRKLIKKKEYDINSYKDMGVLMMHVVIDKLTTYENAVIMAYAGMEFMSKLYDRVKLIDSYAFFTPCLIATKEFTFIVVPSAKEYKIIVYRGQISSNDIVYTDKVPTLFMDEYMDTHLDRVWRKTYKKLFKKIRNGKDEISKP